MNQVVACKSTQDRVVTLILRLYPQAQAIYLFGSNGTPQERADSDVDVAVLLPSAAARESGSLALSELHLALQEALRKDVDLVNLRQVSTVFQKEITMNGRRVFAGDEYAADEFEMLVLSMYQKLNQERAEIMAAGLQSGRFYDP